MGSFRAAGYFLVASLIFFSISCAGKGLQAESEEAVRGPLFKTADAVLKKAQDNRADFFAPKSFSEGMSDYEAAEKALAEGESVNKIQNGVEGAIEHFKRAVSVAEKAENLFADTILAREDALSAEVSKYTPDLWQKAEEKFEYARKYLEDGDESKAKGRSKEAAEIYREAELKSIKASHLKAVWDLLEQADDRNVIRYAPRTIEKARNLVDKADEMLNRDRYSAGEVMNLASSAEYQALHGLFLSEKIKKLKDDNKTMEDILLEAEKPIEKIARALDQEVSFEQGVDPAVQTIIDTIHKLQEEKGLLSRTLEAKGTDIAELIKQRSEKERIIQDKNAQIAELNLKVDSLEMQLQKLQMLEEQLRSKEIKNQIFKQKLKKIANSFESHEATVRQTVGGDIMIRLYGLSFPEGMAVIEPKYFSLLAKVNEAIAEFPGCDLTIEGHTDSTGTRKENLKLSHERAVAIMEYVQANTNLKRDRIKAEGFGEQRPVATNDTVQGRAKNRRIDIIISPSK